MPPELLQQFEKIGPQETVRDPVVIARFYCPHAAAAWYVTSFDEDTGLFYGFCIGLGGDGWDSFCVTDLQNLRIPVHITYKDNVSKRKVTKKIHAKIERDGNFRQRRFSEVLPEYFYDNE